MSVIEQTQITVAPCWRVMRRWLAYLMLAANLTACCAPMAVTPRIPPPAADLMIPAPTGSEVSQRATQSTQSWLEMLQDGPIK